MLVYLSALAPCIAFTYLLRGVNVITIGMLLYYTFLASLVFSVVGLLLATLTRSKNWQSIMSVVLILALVIVFFATCRAVLGEGVLEQELSYDQWEFWIAQAGLLTAYVSYLVLFFLAAASRISFASDNRSTRLRVVMLVQQILLLGWVAYGFLWAWSETRSVMIPPELLMVILMVTGIHWYVMGAFMTGENARLSPRVQRHLPRSFLGRALLTWFNPGPSTGYMFAVVNLLAAVVVVSIVVLVLGAGGGGLAFRANADDVILFGVLLLCYVINYLGLGRLTLMLLRRFSRTSPFLAPVLNVLLLLIGVALPLVLQYSVLFEDDYTALQITNPFWTLFRVFSGRSLAAIGTDAWLLYGLLITSAGFMFFINLIIAVNEVRYVRQAAPDRVREDEAELHPEIVPAPVQATPWD